MMNENPTKQVETSARSKRVWVRRVVSILVLGALLLVAFRDRPEVRLLLARTADFAYSNIDPFSETHPIDYGPAVTEVAHESNPGSQQPFPGYELRVEFQQPSLPREHVEFAHEWLSHDRVKKFQELLPFELTEATSVFEMSDLVRSLTNHGEASLPDVGDDPIAYLEFATDGRPLTCRYFAILFGATANAAGYTPRLFSLSKDGRKRAHAVAEVYVPELSKWIVIDPDFNVAYRKDGVWLDARELHQAWLSFKRQLASENQDIKELEHPAERVRAITGVELVELGPAGSELRKSNMYGASPTGINLEFYQYVIYKVRNDFLSATYPVGHPVRNREYVLQEDTNAPLPPIADTAYLVDDVNRFYWPVGRSHISIEDWKTAERPAVSIKLSTWTPNFKEFEVRYNETTWNITNDHTLTRELHEGANHIEVRSINVSGLRGETSQLNIHLTTKTSLTQIR